MGVVVLLVLIWTAVLLPPALRSHAARQEAFLVSLGSAAALPRPAGLQAQRVARRRRIAGGLLTATVGSLLMGLLPTFRDLLIVHLFLLDSFIAYIALLAHGASRAARPVSAPSRVARSLPVAPPAPALPARRLRRAVVPEVGSVAPLT